MNPIRRKKNKSGRKLPGALYTIPRTPVSQKEVSFDKKEPNKLWIWLQAKVTELFRSLKKKRRGNFRRKSTPGNPVAEATARRRVSDTLMAGGPHTSRRKRKIAGREWVTFAGIMGGAAGAVVIVAAVVLLLLQPETTNVTINDSGRIICANTTEETVGELLHKNGIALDDSDVLEVSLSAKLEEDMEIVIRRANTVTISDEDGDKQIKMLAGTVGEALERAGITLGVKDEVYPDAGTYVYAGMTINVIRVDVKYETQTETLEYREITKESDEYEKGKTVLMQRGVAGSQEHTVEVVYKNGEEYSREIIETKVIAEPVDEIIYVGTYVKPTPEPTKKPEAPEKTKKPSSSKADKTKKPATSADTGANNKKDDDGKLTKAPSIEQIHSGTWAEHKAVAGPASSIIAKTVTAKKVTAYTHTGNKTATGTWPRIGTVAANPKQVAYGTKIYVPGYGYGRIEDTGANKHDLSDYLFDVFLETEAECRKWGVKRNLKVYILKG